MIILGKRQTLTMVKKAPFGAYLRDTTDREAPLSEEVLLPKKEVPSDLELHDPIDVFIYRDSDDRLIATVKDPLIHLGETAELTVKDTASMGAFLDWGLEKDLFLPFKEQKGRPTPGDKVKVSLYIDKSNRLCATMWISGEKKKQDAYEMNADILLGYIKKHKGYLPLTDKSSPEDIKKMTGMSKNEFKKASGKLYKERKVSLEDDGIHLIS